MEPQFRLSHGGPGRVRGGTASRSKLAADREEATVHVRAAKREREKKMCALSLFGHRLAEKRRLRVSCVYGLVVADQKCQTGRGTPVAVAHM